MPKFIRRHQKALDKDLYKKKRVFGVPLKLVCQLHGQALPLPILQIMRHLRLHAPTAVGIFRKSGSKQRMNLIREHIELANTFDPEVIEKKLLALGSRTVAVGHQTPELSSSIELSSQSDSKSELTDEICLREALNAEMLAIDLADIVKQYFRELPECLFTNKISQTLIRIFTCKHLFS